MNVKNIQPVVPSSSSTFSQLRALFKGQVLALCLVILLNFIASGMLNPILPLYLTDLGASGVMVGLLMSVFGLGEGIFGFIWGSLADRIGITIPLSVQMAGLFLSLVGFALFPIIGMVFMLRFVMASLGSAIWPTGRGFLAYSVPLGSKGLAMAVFAVLVNGGMNIGSFVSGAIVDNFGYSTLFLTAASLCALGALVVVTKLRGARIVRSASSDVSQAAADLANEESEYLKPILILSSVVFLVAIVFSTVFTFVPLLMTDFAGLTPSQVGLVFGVSGLVSLLILIPAGRLSDRGGYRTALVLGLGLMLLAVLGLSYARTLILIMLFTIFSSVGRWITDPPLLSLLSDITPLRYQGRSQGIYVVAVDIGIMTGPFAAGISWDHSGPRATFFFLAGIVILALLVTSFLMREREWLNHTATAGYQEPVSD